MFLLLGHLLKKIKKMMVCKTLIFLQTELKRATHDNTRKGVLRPRKLFCTSQKQRILFYQKLNQSLPLINSIITINKIELGYIFVKFTNTNVKLFQNTQHCISIRRVRFLIISKRNFTFF